MSRMMSVAKTYTMILRALEIRKTGSLTRIATDFIYVRHPISCF